MANLVYELERLAALRDRKMLTEAEFLYSKAAVIRCSGGYNFGEGEAPAKASEKESRKKETRASRAASSENFAGPTCGMEKFPPMKEPLADRETSEEASPLPSGGMDGFFEEMAEAKNIHAALVGAMKNGEDDEIRALLHEQSKLTDRRAITPPM